MSIMRNYKCLMIKTKDRRKFFTDEKNFTPLIEFSKVFKAEISVVKVQEAEILALSDLAPALCNPSYHQEPQPKYEVIQVKVSQIKRPRQDILKNADKIRKHIKRNLLAGKEVVLKQLCKNFADMRISSACICTHIKNVRKELEAEGYQFEKTGGGRYKKVG